MKKQGQLLDDAAVSDQFVGGLDPAFRHRLRLQLHAEDPTRHPDEAFELSKIKKAALLILSYSPRMAQDFDPTAPTVKREQFDASQITRQISGAGNLTMAQFAQELSKYWPKSSSPGGQNNYRNYNSQSSNTVLASSSNNYNSYTPRARTRECIFCSDPAHYLYKCPKADEYVQKGLCRHSTENQIVLPNGERPNVRVNPGKNLMERFDHWHNAQRNQVTSNIITVVEEEEAPEEEAANYMQAHFVWNEVDDSDDEEDVHENYAMPEEDEETRLLQLVLSNAQKKLEERQNKLKSRKQNGPTTRSAAAKQNAPSGASPSAKQSPPKSGKPTLTKAAEPTMAEAALASAPKKPERSGPPTLPMNSHGPPQNGQFRYTTPIEDSKIVKKVMEDALDATLPISIREILAIAPDARKFLKEQINTKKVLNDAGKSSAPTQDTAQVGIVECFMMSLPERTDGIITSNHSEKLRAIDIIIDGCKTVEAIIDEGSQIIGISKKVWETLGLVARRDHLFKMESANSSVDMTLRLLHDLKVTIGSYDFYLQVQVVENASYEVLLGLPFHVLTQLGTKFYSDGSSHITIDDPNTGAKIILPTHERKRVDKEKNGKEEAKIVQTGF